MPRPRKNVLFEGLKWGHLTITKELERDRFGIGRYECKCDCGLSAILRTNHFVPERKFCTLKCGLLQKHRMPDLIGKTFGYWKVSGVIRRSRCAVWQCVCVCGNKQEMETYALTNGVSESCGCIANQRRSKGYTPEQKLARKREISRISANKYPARRKAGKIRYEAQLKRATPAWLTDEDWEEMNAIYRRAQELTRSTGVRHEVDHKIPLNGKTVTGLHVPANLQILTQAQNVSKSNKYAELSGD